MEQLEDKDLKLRVLSDEQNNQVKMKEMSREKSRVQVATVKRQLQRERVLKMDAYQRVDELQTQVIVRDDRLGFDGRNLESCTCKDSFEGAYGSEE